MYRVAALAVVAGTVLAALSVSAQETNAAPAVTPTVVTSGEATVRRAPDQAFVTLAVETRAASPRAADDGVGRAAAHRGSRRPTPWHDRLFHSAGNSTSPNGRRTPRGCMSRATASRSASTIERVGELLDAFVDAGATTVTGVRFDVKDRTAAEREALRMAVADARARADAMAAGAGRNVDRVIRITDTVQPRFRTVEPMLMQRASAAVAEPTPIEAGLIEIHAQVELTVSIK